jgi:Tfp pilus assembly protein PilP
MSHAGWFSLLYFEIAEMISTSDSTNEVAIEGKKVLRFRRGFVVGRNNGKGK